MPVSPQREPFYDALRLSDADRKALLTMMNEKQAGARFSETRVDQRLAYTVKGLLVQLHHPGGSRVSYVVRPRNLSRQGIAFFHGSFVYTGTPCDLTLRSNADHGVTVAGQVVRCQHLQDLVHEVAVMFDEPIDVKQFTRSQVNTADGAAHELPRLAGKVLLVEDSEDDRELLTFHLEPLGLQIEHAGNGADAKARLEAGGIDLVITEMRLPGMSGPQLIEALRTENCLTPVVVLTSDQQAQAAGANAIIGKPYALEELAATLSRYLKHEPEAEADPLLSDHWQDEKMRPLILKYLERLDTAVNKLGELVQSPEQFEQADRMLAQLRGSAGGYGFPQLGEAAGRLQAALDRTAEDAPDQVRAQFEELSRITHAAVRAREQG